jgi:hypothetical protein
MLVSLSGDIRSVMTPVISFLSVSYSDSLVAPIPDVPGMRVR